MPAPMLNFYSQLSNGCKSSNDQNRVPLTNTRTLYRHMLVGQRLNWHKTASSQLDNVDTLTIEPFLAGQTYHKLKG